MLMNVTSRMIVTPQRSASIYLDRTNASVLPEKLAMAELYATVRLLAFKKVYGKYVILDKNIQIKDGSNCT